jgi:hypothetical protein
MKPPESTNFDPERRRLRPPAGVHWFAGAVISGGQTGADRAALDFAIKHKIPHAGFCPRGRKAEDGRIPPRYQLAETKSDQYPERTRRNVELADATAIFSRVSAEALLRQLRSGSGLTVREAARAGRPFVVLSNFPNALADAAELCTFLEERHPAVLNVAGARESSQPGIAAHVAAVLEAVILRLPIAPRLFC